MNMLKYFDEKSVEPIAKLIGINREPTNEEMQEAAKVALDLVVTAVNALVAIAARS